MANRSSSVSGLYASAPSAAAISPATGSSAAVSSAIVAPAPANRGPAASGHLTSNATSLVDNPNPCFVCADVIAEGNFKHKCQYQPDREVRAGKKPIYCGEARRRHLTHEAMTVPDCMVQCTNALLAAASQYRQSQSNADRFFFDEASRNFKKCNADRQTQELFNREHLLASDDPAELKRKLVMAERRVESLEAQVEHLAAERTNAHLCIMHQCGQIARADAEHRFDAFMRLFPGQNEPVPARRGRQEQRRPGA
ncbi:hypothetical protein GGR57DRAFT_403155 [Xylariaceae sp. FL1272]|nr:hypothetical protein GGR57DRAFT_403155 [Xylariaceae sp. FL1272]